MARFVKRHVLAGSRILELGCGAGANLVWLNENGYDSCGVDVAWSAIERVPWSVSKPHEAGRPWISARVASVTEIPYPDNDFDCVVDVCCLQHVRDIDAALKEAYRVLRPNGWVFSVWAAHAHSDAAFPAGIYTRKLIDGIEAFYLLRKQGFEEFRAYRSSYEDEVYGHIEHLLVQSQKLPMKG